ncbi:Glycine dehydrogenase (decarboxylating) [Streptomyces griseomycini]
MTAHRTPLSELEQGTPFEQRHIGPDHEAQAKMLAQVGYGSLDELTAAAVPDVIKNADALDLPGARTEAEVLAELRSLADRNEVLGSMIGLGYYGTFTPPVILRNVMENPAWYTAYTPYQPEISQGRLEALLNFQTMVAELTGLPTSGASLLDEGTAAAEAMALSRRMGKNKKGLFLVDADALPQTIAVIETRAEPTGVEVVVADLSEGIPAEVAEREINGVLIQYPGASGAVRDIKPVIDQAHELGALVTVAADLLALTLLRSPGELGADIAVGTTQRFGVPMGFGGPHAGYMAVQEKMARSLPGRLVGVSVDADGNRAYRLALQTREQHIRREKATSNICTAQVLLAVMAGMYAVYHGPEGLRTIARRTHRYATVLAEGLKAGGAEIVHDSYFDTLTVRVPGRAAEVVAAARDNGVNLRLVDADQVSIACDETTTRDRLAAVWSAFGVEGDVEALDAAARDTLPDALLRSDEFLTHPVVQQHRSETGGAALPAPVSRDRGCGAGRAAASRCGRPGRRAVRPGAAAGGGWPGRGRGPRAGPGRRRGGGAWHRRARPGRCGPAIRRPGHGPAPCRCPGSAARRPRCRGRSGAGRAGSPSEDDTDRARLGGRACRCSSAPSSSRWPAVRGARPASARRAVVLPAPFGPSRATTSPGAAVSAMSRRKEPRSTTSRASSPSAEGPGVAPAGPGVLPGFFGAVSGTVSGRPHPAVPQPGEYGDGHRQQHQAEGDRGGRVALQGEVHRERHGLGAAGEVAGEGDRRAELAEGPGPGEDGTGRDARGDQRQGDPAERGEAGGAQGGGRLLVARVGGPQRALDADDEERHRHERLGEDDARGGEGQGDAEPGVQPLADDAVAPQGEQQGDAAHHRGEDQGKRHQGADQTAAGEVRTGQQPGQRDADDQAQRGRRRGADQRQAQRLPHLGAGQLLGQTAPGSPEEEREEGDQEEGEAQEGGHEEGEGNAPAGGAGTCCAGSPHGPRPAPAAAGGRRGGARVRRGGVPTGHGARNPAPVRTFRPSGDFTSAMNAFAAAGFRALSRRAIG